MINIQEKALCCGCGACAQRCPYHCITMSEDEEGFLYPVVNLSKCIDCGLCEKVCPIINKAIIHKPIVVYASKNPDEIIRLESSSGGMFSIFANHIIANGGVVFGARFNDKWEVVHDYTERIDGLAAFRGSKYVQSYTGKTFCQVEDLLKQGRPVLYSGTPCQILGLRRFLRKEYENLICIDIVCHGVPSPKVWKEYSRSLFYRRPATYISFRDKSVSWEDYCFVAKSPTKTIRHSHDFDPYMKLFLSGIIERPSCSQCPARADRSESDITLADFWGIDQLYPTLNDHKGFSVLVIRSLKGLNEVTSTVEEKLLYQINYEEIVQYNPALQKDFQFSSERENFWNVFNVDQNKAIRLFSKSLLPPFTEKIKHRLYILLQKVFIKLSR